MEITDSGPQEEPRVIMSVPSFISAQSSISLAAGQGQQQERAKLKNWVNS
jgi:hypothetical protein